MGEMFDIDRPSSSYGIWFQHRFISTCTFNRRTNSKIFYFLESQHLNNQEKYLRFSVHVRAIHKEASTSVIRGRNLIIILRNSVLEIRSGEFNGEKKTSVSVILAIK